MSDQSENLRKLCILNAKETQTNWDIVTACEEFGQPIDLERPPKNKRLAFPLFASTSDAEAVKIGLLQKGYRVGYAYKKAHTTVDEARAQMENGSDVVIAYNAVDEARAQMENGSDVVIAYVCDDLSIYICPFNVEFTNPLAIVRDRKQMLVLTENDEVLPKTSIASSDELKKLINAKQSKGHTNDDNDHEADDGSGGNGAVQAN